MKRISTQKIFILESRAEPAPKQNIWLEMSPFPRPTFGWIKAGKNMILMYY